MRTDEWETPQELYDKLDKEFHFDLDPCSTEWNHKTPWYYTEEQDGLKQSWGGRRVWCNPPYSNIREWVAKGYQEAMHPGTVVVMLLPASTDTRWYWDYVYGRSEVRFIKGRLRFSGSAVNAPFASMLVIYRAAGM